jgi:hypothetical protein
MSAKKNLKSITPSTTVAAKSLKSGLTVFNTCVIDEAKAGQKIGTALESLAMFMLATYGVVWCSEPKSDAFKMFAKAWDDNYIGLVNNAPAGEQATIANRKGLYYKRAKRAGCLLAIKTGKVMTPDQKEYADALIAKYDSNKSRKKGTLEKRSIKQRALDDIGAFYKMMMARDEHEGMSDTKVAAITGACEQILRACGHDPAQVAEKKNSK